MDLILLNAICHLSTRGGIISICPKISRNISNARACCRLLIHGIQEYLVAVRFPDFINDKFHGIDGVHFLQESP
jgi:hypothetical protein